MGKCSWTAAVVATLALSNPAFADGGRIVRVAEVIRMEQSEASKRNVVAHTGNISGDFHLLDLAQERISEAMRARFHGFRTEASDDVSEIGNAAFAQSAVAAKSDIVVPTWMQTPLLSTSPLLNGPFVTGCMTNVYRPSGFLPRHIETRRRAAYHAMSVAACEAGIPVSLFDALVLSESAYDANAVSPKRAFGFAQLMPGTAAGLGVDRFDPLENLKGGARYLRAQLDNFGHVHLALAAYNAGPGRVKGGRVPPIAETQSYVRNVLDKWARLTNSLRTAASTTFSSTAPRQPASIERVRAADIQVF